MLMRQTIFVLLFALGLSAPNALDAQAAAPMDSAQLAAMRETAMRQSQPVDFVLQHQADLALTSVQVSALTALRASLRDSAAVRQARLVTQMRNSPPSPAMIAAAGWSGAIDEAALRTALCQQAGGQAEVMLALAHDRRLVAALLTPAQAAQLPTLQTADMMNAMKRR